MGLNMISKSLALIHASLTLLLPLLFALFAIGCKDEKAMDWGPEVAPEEIDAAVSEAVAEYDPNTMKVGEWAQIDETVQSNGSVFLISDMAQRVTLEEEDATTVTFHVVENRRWFDDNLNVTKQVDTEFPLMFEKAPAISSRSSDGKLGDPIYRLNQLSQELKESSRSGEVTIHNLKKTMTLDTPPSAIASKPDCSQIYPNCKIRVYTIEFDLVIWKDGKGENIHQEYKISPDTPLLGMILSECQSGILPWNNQNLYVKQCTVANNFIYGN
jgi:hypothetical protein